MNKIKVLLKIGLNKENPTCNILADYDSCFDIYWNYFCSVQSIGSKLFISAYNVDDNHYFDITKGNNGTTISEEWIITEKNHKYMFDRLNKLKKTI